MTEVCWPNLCCFVTVFGCSYANFYTRFRPQAQENSYEICTHNYGPTQPLESYFWHWQIPLSLYESWDLCDIHITQANANFLDALFSTTGLISSFSSRSTCKYFGKPRVPHFVWRSMANAGPFWGTHRFFACFPTNVALYSRRDVANHIKKGECSRGTESSLVPLQWPPTLNSSLFSKNCLTWWIPEHKNVGCQLEGQKDCVTDFEHFWRHTQGVLRNSFNSSRDCFRLGCKVGLAPKDNREYWLSPRSENTVVAHDQRHPLWAPIKRRKT